LLLPAEEQQKEWSDSPLEDTYHTGERTFYFSTGFG
jgi:hypothetical protein